MRRLRVEEIKIVYEKNRISLKTLIKIETIRFKLQKVIKNKKRKKRRNKIYKKININKIKSCASNANSYIGF